MWLVAQITVGVFLGLWLFRWAMTRQPGPKRDWVKVGLAVLGMSFGVLSLLHLVFLAWR